MTLIPLDSSKFENKLEDCSYQDLGDFAGNQSNSLVTCEYLSEVRVKHHQMALLGTGGDMTLPNVEKTQGSVHRYNIQ